MMFNAYIITGIEGLAGLYLSYYMYRLWGSFSRAKDLVDDETTKAYCISISQSAFLLAMIILLYMVRITLMYINTLIERTAQPIYTTYFLPDMTLRILSIISFIILIRILRKNKKKFSKLLRGGKLTR